MSTKAHTAKEAASEQLQRTRILIIEDNADIRRSLAKLFEMEHFEVVTADDGPAGVDLADCETPDAIIVDINLPHLSGVDVIKILRRQPRFSVIPIVAITAYGNWAMAKAIEAGADIALMKPLEPDELITLLRQLLADPQSLHWPELQSV